MARIKLDNLSKTFADGTAAVNNLNIEVQDSELMVIVGPSGCGKTTTLRMIAGLEKPSGGTILIEDKIVNDIPPYQRNIAMVFQNYGLYPYMTVGKNLSFALKMRKIPGDQIEERVSQAVELLDIGSILDKKPSSLSGGQRQRVALGAAIVRKPKVLLLDEPLSNLDAMLRTNLRAELKNLQRKLGFTMIYVTHDQYEAVSLGDRICVMNNGIAQQTGTAQEIFSQPANEFVNAFFIIPC